MDYFIKKFGGGGTRTLFSLHVLPIYITLDVTGTGRNTANKCSVENRLGEGFMFSFPLFFRGDYDVNELCPSHLLPIGFCVEN